jgi:hypothetical protein
MGGLKMFEAIINLNDFTTLENTYEASDFYEKKETGYQECKVKGFIRVKKEVFAENMGFCLTYEINENNNLNPKWIFEYKFKIDGLLNDFEVIEISKIEDGYVYFKTNV